MDQGEHPALRVLESPDGLFIRFEYAEGIAFTLDASASRIWVHAPAYLSDDYAAEYLLNPILAFCLRSRQIMCLHASTVAVQGCALVIAGASGAGKSTLASVFLAKQHQLVADEVCALDIGGDRIFARPGYARVRLYPDSADATLGDAAQLGRIIDGWDKRYFELASDSPQFLEQSLPIRAIYVLGERDDHMAVRALSTGEALVALMNHGYLDYLLDSPARAVALAQVAKIVQGVPVRSLTPHRDIARVSELYDLVLNDFRLLPDCSS